MRRFQELNILFSLAANTAFIALMAADLGINKASNINWARGQIHYMLGDNPRQSSYVVGFGQNPPKRPHHKSRYSFIVDELPTSPKHMCVHKKAQLITIEKPDSQRGKVCPDK